MNLTQFQARNKMIGGEFQDLPEIGFYDLTFDFDLEKNNRNQIKRKIRTIQATFPKHPIKIRNSASGKNYHLKVCLKTPMTPRENIEHRRKLGDDPMRIALDVMRAKEKYPYTMNTIFQEKRGKKAGKWKTIKKKRR